MLISFVITYSALLSAIIATLLNQHTRLNKSAWRKNCPSDVQDEVVMLKNFYKLVIPNPVNEQRLVPS